MVLLWHVVQDAPVKTTMVVNAKGKVKKAVLRSFLVDQEAILLLKRTLGLTGMFLEGHTFHILVARVPHA